MLLCSVVMALGTSIGGYKIIKSVGMGMVKLETYQGFSADIAAAGALLLSSSYWNSSKYDTYKNNSYHGCWSLKKTFRCKLVSCKRNGSRLGINVPRLWINRIFNGTLIHVVILIFKGRKDKEQWKEKKITIILINSLS